MAAAYVAHLHRSPRRWVTYVLLFLVYFLLFTVVARAAGDEHPAASGIGIAVLTGCVAIVAMNLWAYLAMRRSGRLAFVGGAIYESAWNETGLWMRGPGGGESFLPYAVISSVIRRGNWVFLKTTNSRAVCLYPSVLVPEEVIQRVCVTAPDTGC